METILFSTELRPFKFLVILFLHYRIWSMCNHFLPQFSMNRFQTLHTFCQHYKDMHTEL